MPPAPRKKTQAMPVGRATRIETADIFNKRVAGGVRATRAGIDPLIQMSQNLLQDSQQHFANASRTIAGLAELDDQAHKARSKSDALQIVMDSKLLLDKQLQSLEHDPDIDPLTLADEADALIQKETQAAMTKGSEYGIEIRDFVRDKMSTYRVDKVPALRSKGYKLESDQAVAKLKQRNFMRQAEMNEPGVTPQRRNELANEMMADIGSQSGVNLSNEDAQAMIQGIVEDTVVSAWYERVLVEPREAMAALGQIQGITPEKRLTMRNTATSIMNAEMARMDRLEVRDRRMREERSKALVNSATNKIISAQGGWDPRSLASDPQAAATFRDGELAGLVRFYDSLYAPSKDAPTIAGMTAYADLLVDAHSGKFTPSQIKFQAQLNMERGYPLEPKHLDDLVNAANAAQTRLEGVDRAATKEATDRGESYVKQFFDPLAGPYAAMNEQYGAQIRLASVSALTDYHKSLQAAYAHAKEQDQDPRVAVSPEAVAFDVMTRHSETVKPLYNQFLKRMDNDALRQTIAPPGADIHDPFQFKKALIQERDAGRMSPADAKAALSYDALLRSMESMNPGLGQAQPNQTQQNVPGLTSPAATPAPAKPSRNPFSSR